MSDISIGDIVKYIPGSWAGCVIDIKNDSQTKQHGHTGDVYLVKDLFGTETIATIKTNLQKAVGHNTYSIKDLRFAYMCGEAIYDSDGHLIDDIAEDEFEAMLAWIKNNRIDNGQYRKG